MLRTILSSSVIVAAVSVASAQELIREGPVSPQRTQPEYFDPQRVEQAYQRLQERKEGREMRQDEMGERQGATTQQADPQQNLEQTNRQLQARVEQLERENRQLRQQMQEMRGDFRGAQRAAERQAPDRVRQPADRGGVVAPGGDAIIDLRNRQVSPRAPIQSGDTPEGAPQDPAPAQPRQAPDQRRQATDPPRQTADQPRQTPDAPAGEDITQSPQQRDAGNEARPDDRR